MDKDAPLGLCTFHAGKGTLPPHRKNRNCIGWTPCEDSDKEKGTRDAF